jgi:glutamate--cysteine ligase
MMCATAGLQVNLDLGDDLQVAERWHRAHAVGPALAAAFANSPVPDGPLAGWASARLATWFAIDPSRTAPPACTERAEPWSDYALDAKVMLIRVSDGRYEALDGALSFRSWVADGHPLGYPDADDLDYHLTTLFPPVRPRGWLEVRYLDALPDPWWRVAVAVLTAVIDDADAASAATRAVAGTEGLWVESARHGMADDRLAAAATGCFAAALPALDRIGVDDRTVAAAKEYVERFVSTRRCPGDDAKDGWRAGREWWWSPLT